MLYHIQKYLHSSYVLRRDINILASHFVKNTIIFLVGISVLLALGLSVPKNETILAYFGFIFTYSAIYMFNDYFDYEEDKLYYTKKKYKPSIYKGITKEELINYGSLSLIIGLVLSSLVNIVFLQVMLILLLLNLLHSNMITRFKEHLTIANVNIFIMQVLKFALPWFVVYEYLAFLPWSLLLYFSAAYILLYASQKHPEFRSSKLETGFNILVFALIGLFFLFYSIYRYNYIRLPIIVSLFFGSILFGLMKTRIDIASNIENLMSLYSASLLVFLIATLF